MQRVVFHLVWLNLEWTSNSSGVCFCWCHSPTTADGLSLWPCNCPRKCWNEPDSDVLFHQEYEWCARPFSHCCQEERWTWNEGPQVHWTSYAQSGLWMLSSTWPVHEGCLQSQKQPDFHMTSDGGYAMGKSDRKSREALQSTCCFLVLWWWLGS